jgi:hypothetical protein
VIGKSAPKASKHVIWDNISTQVSNNWSQFSLIGDELELLTSAKKDITRTTNELENKPDLANEIIKFLNNRTKEKLKDLNVIDRTNIVIDSKKVLTKRRLMKNVENKLHEMIGEVASFKRIFTDLIKIGLPLPWDGNGYIQTQNKYQELLENKRNDDSRFEKLEGVLKGQDVLEMLAGDFEILHNIRVIFKNLPQPSYERYTNMDELVRNMNKTEYPMGKTWNHMCQFSKIPFARQGESSGTRPNA